MSHDGPTRFPCSLFASASAFVPRTSRLPNPALRRRQPCYHGVRMSGSCLRSHCPLGSNVFSQIGRPGRVTISCNSNISRCWRPQPDRLHCLEALPSHAGRRDENRDLRIHAARFRRPNFLSSSSSNSLYSNVFYLTMPNFVEYGVSLPNWSLIQCGVPGRVAYPACAQKLAGMPKCRFKWVHFPRNLLLWRGGSEGGSLAHPGRPWDPASRIWGLALQTISLNKSIRAKSRLGEISIGCVG